MSDDFQSVTFFMRPSMCEAIEALRSQSIHYGSSDIDIGGGFSHVVTQLLMIALSAIGEDIDRTITGYAKDAVLFDTYIAHMTAHPELERLHALDMPEGHLRVLLRSIEHSREIAVDFNRAGTMSEAEYEAHLHLDRKDLAAVRIGVIERGIETRRVQDAIKQALRAPLPVAGDDEPEEDDDDDSHKDGTNAHTAIMDALRAERAQQARAE